MTDIFYIYILKCNDNSYYIGNTSNIERRISEHNLGLAIYTSSRRPLKLVLLQSFESKNEAFIFERKIKGWSRKKKEALISKNWEELKLFSKKKSFKSFNIYDAPFDTIPNGITQDAIKE